MAPQIFSTVPDNVLIQIFTLIQDAHLSTLYSLLFIKSTKLIAEKLIYRRVTIRGTSPWESKHWPAHKSLLGRLLNPEDILNSHVRELAIADWPGPVSADFGVDVLEKLIGSIKELLVFKWESWPHIPPIVLSKFHTLFPGALLDVKNRERGRPPRSQNRKDMAIDLDLLRSPQLHSLDFVILRNGDFSSCSPDREISEFPVLKHILQRSPNLRILKLGSVQEPSYEFGRFYQRYAEFNTDGDGPLNLQFKNKDSFPNLVEIGILKEDIRANVPGYDLSASHCIAWKAVMNWKALTKLDLGNARPNDFFMIFRGQIPQLKTLKFRLSRGSDSQDDSTTLLQATKQFLNSIKGLDELIVEDRTRYFFPDLWHCIQKHEHSLRSLGVNASESSNSNVPGWAAEPLTQLLEGLPRLTTLSMAVDLLKSPGYSNRNKIAWPNKPFSLLSSFSTIEFLKIRIRMPPAGHGKPKIDHDSVSKMATDLFKEFYEQNIPSRLKLVDIQVQRETRSFYESGLEGVTAKVKKSVRDDAPSLVEGGFEVKVDNSFDES